MPQAVEGQGLERTFKGGVRGVQGVDLAVDDGEIFGFLGPNGAGKSTTVRMLCTLLRPTAGRASVAGLDVVAEAGALRHLIGVARHGPAIGAHMQGREAPRPPA